MMIIVITVTVMMLFLIYLIHTHYGDDIYNLNLKCYRLQS